MTSTIKFAYSSKVHSVGDYLTTEVGSYPNLKPMPVKIVKINAASVQLENGDVVMASTLRNRKPANAVGRWYATTYSIVRDGADIEQMKAEAEQATEASKQAKEEALARQRAARDEREAAQAAKRAEIAALNDTALRNYQTTTMPDGTMMHTTQLVNIHGASQVWMFVVKSRKDWYGEKDVVELDCAVYGDRYRNEDKSFSRETLNGMTVYEALLNGIC